MILQFFNIWPLLGQYSSNTGQIGRCLASLGLCLAYTWLMLGLCLDYAWPTYAWPMLGMESHSRDLGMDSHPFLLYFLPKIRKFRKTALSSRLLSVKSTDLSKKWPDFYGKWPRMTKKLVFLNLQENG